MTEEDDVRRADALDRVLTRLALTSEKNSQQVIQKLLPAVISELSCSSAKVVLQKVIQILSTCNKVLAAQPEVKIPVEPLLQVCLEENASQVARSYALMYAEKGFLREDADFQANMLQKIFDSLEAFKAASTRSVMYRLALVSLGSGGGGDGEVRLGRGKANFLEFALHFVLYQGPYNTRAVVSPGLSPELMGSLRCQDEDYDNTVRRKVRMLKFLAREAEAELLLPVLLAASEDPNESVSSLGESLLRKRAAISNVKPLVDLEDKGLIDRLFGLFHGSIQAVSEASKKVEPASLGLRVRILGCFIRSLRAANGFPLSLKTIFESLYGAGSNARLKLAGMEYCIWTLQHADQDQLRLVGPLVLQGLVKSLTGQRPATLDQGAVRLRAFSYEGIAELSKRLPQAFSDNVEIIGVLMREVTTEVEQVKVSAMECLRLIASAYKSTGSDAKAKLEQMLNVTVSSPSVTLRLLSVAWASTVFKTQDLHGLFLVIQATGDAEESVSQEAEKLLKWERLQEEAGKGAVSTSKMHEYFMKRHGGADNDRVLMTMIKAIRCVRTGELRHAREDLGLSSSPLLTQGLRSEAKETVLEAVQLLLVEAYAGFGVQVDPSIFRTLMGHANLMVRKGAARLFACTSSLELLEGVMDNLLRLSIKKDFEKMESLCLCLSLRLGHAAAAGVELPSSLTDRFHNYWMDDEATDSLSRALCESVGIMAACNVGGIEYSRYTIKLKKLAESTAVSTVKEAVLALGRIHCHLGPSASELSLFLLDLVPKLKEEKLVFALGEALAILSGAPINLHSLLLFDSQLMEEGLAELCPEETSLANSSGDPKILEAVISKHAMSPDPKTRRNAAIVMVSIIKRVPAVVAEKCVEIQSCFTELVADSDSVTQNFASMGVSLVFQVSPPETRTLLVNNLVGVLTAGRGAKKQKLAADTKLFDGDVLGRDPAGNKIETYRHLCSMAHDVGGGSDLVYKFINLFNEKALLNSMSGAALGLQEISKIAQEELKPLLPKLVPKLFRMMHDPSPAVAEGMELFWASLVDDPKDVVTRFFPGICEELLNHMTSNLWRSRQSSAAALTSLVPGRRWLELSPYFVRMWDLCFRVMDDIKETVRLEAISLATTLKRTTVRLCESSESGVPEVVLPVLLPKLASPVKEVKAISLQVLHHLVKFSNPDVLRGHMVAISSHLLEALSGLENTTLNYIEQHAERVGIDKDELDNLRIQAANSSMVGDMLDRLSGSCDQTNIESFCLKMQTLLKSGFGTNTRAGTCKFLSSVILRMRHDMKPFSRKLLKTLVTSSRASPPAVVRAYSGTFAILAKFSSESAVSKTLDIILENVQSDEAREQRFAGVFLLDLCRLASDVFVASRDRILPPVFVLMHHTEEKKVAELFSSIWAEGAPSDAAALRLYHAEIVDLCSSHLDSDSWHTRSAAARAVVSVVKKARKSDFKLPFEHSARLSAQLALKLNGRYWKGVESVVEALALMGGDLALATLLKCLKRKKLQLATIDALALTTSMIAAGAKEQQTALRDLLQELANPSADRDEDEDEDENEDSMKGAAKVKEKAAKLLSQLDEEE